MNSTTTAPALPAAQQYISFSGSTTTATNLLSPTPESAINIHEQRSISDSVLGYGRRMGPSNYNRSNTFSMMVNRSGSKTVSVMIDAMNTQCARQEEWLDLASAFPYESEYLPPSSVSAPEEECCILAHWAVDSYYRVVIVGRHGIPALIRTMNTFVTNRGIQECCCLALGNLCAENLLTATAIEKSHGITAILAAMKNHPQSVAVQSAACDALRNLSGVILPRLASTQSPLVVNNNTIVPHPNSTTWNVTADSMERMTTTTSITQQLIQLLSHAKQMSLLPRHRVLAEALLNAVLLCSRQSIDQTG